MAIHFEAGMNGHSFLFGDGKLQRSASFCNQSLVIEFNA